MEEKDFIPPANCVCTPEKCIVCLSRPHCKECDGKCERCFFNVSCKRSKEQ